MCGIGNGARRYEVLPDGLNQLHADLEEASNIPVWIPAVYYCIPAISRRFGGMSFNGKSGRSCSPGWTYVISCRDLRYRLSAIPAGWSRLSYPFASLPQMGLEGRGRP